MTNEHIDTEADSELREQLAILVDEMKLIKLEIRKNPDAKSAVSMCDEMIRRLRLMIASARTR